MAAAREWLAGSRATLASGFPTGAVSLGYVAMLYSVRAALSEEDLYAKAHSGMWQLFRETFVAPGRFDAALFDSAQRTLPLRMAADYEAAQIDADEAERVVELASRFVAAIEALYPD